MATRATPPPKGAKPLIKVPTRPNQDGVVGGDPKHSKFYILASALSSRRTTRVLAEDESFAIFDVSGDFANSPLEAMGFFFHDTRHLSHFEMKIAGEFPHLLNSYVSGDNSELCVNLTNPDMRDGGDQIVLERDSLQIERKWSLAGGGLVQKITLRNFAPSKVSMQLDFSFGADFADMFELRGTPRDKRGEMKPTQVEKNSVTFNYFGLDQIPRSTRVTFSRRPDQLTDSLASGIMTLKHDESLDIEVRVETRQGEKRKIVAVPSFHAMLERRRGEIKSIEGQFARITTSNQVSNLLLSRSLSDMATLTSAADGGHYVMAGIPWFATLFGRDSIITGLSILPFCPEVAAGILRTLASLQGTRNNDARDEQPGKIIHEMRQCEMANTGEVPFGRYYGSIDSTPLFLWLFDRYVHMTGDLKLADELWPNAQQALGWMEKYGDRDGDGYLEYQRETPRGLANQGWKDSMDAISHADGTLARPPIALAEVQGYAFAAYRGMATIAGKLNRHGISDQLKEKAATLRKQFEQDFWLEKEGMLALALDGNKKPCRVSASNAAHCLATGILNDELAIHQAERLLQHDMFSGWGIRTLSARERRYNPMSYHNGSIWPHDNAIAAYGLACAGRTHGAVTVMEGLFEAALGMRNQSLPELFCGFTREPGLGPVPYPVACQPQAWSAVSVFLLIQALLGIDIDGTGERLILTSPALPSWLEWLRIDDLKVGNSIMSFTAHRGPRWASIEVLEKKGAAQIEIHK